MRQRVEDLGRISILVRYILDHEIFNGVLNHNGPKYSLQSFLDLDEDKKKETIHSLAYGIEDVKIGLYDILSISEGSDFLNEKLDLF